MIVFERFRDSLLGDRQFYPILSHLLSPILYFGDGWDGGMTLKTTEVVYKDVLYTQSMILC